MINIFNEYVKQYDLTVKEIIGKYHHSFRVMDIATNIAKSLNLSEEDIKLASICGLFHDIARFKQFTEYNTFIDRNSFDHGDIGEEILKDLLKDYEYLDIVLLATKYHNKFEIPKLSERETLFCKIIRDADKLDIIREQHNFMNDKEIIIKPKLLNDIYNNRICKNNDVKTDTDVLLRMLSWINDFNYEYSYQFLIDNNIIENKINLLNLYGERKEVEELYKYINNKIEKILGGNYERKN